MRRYVASLWLLSVAAPSAMTVLGAPAVVWLGFFTAAVLLDTGHSISPIAMSWSHAGFRQEMLGRPWKFIALPLAIMALAGSVGAATSAGWTSFVPGPYHSREITDLSNPFPILVWAYILWNFYHFGMQNFGVLRLCGWRSYRWPTMVGCVGLTTVALINFPPIVAFNHWVVAIGLCGKVMKDWRRWAFLAAMPTLGAIAIAWSVPTSHGTMILVIPWLISLRIGLGLVHFLYDRWTWKMSDPAVRATIGRSLILA